MSQTPARVQLQQPNKPAQQGTVAQINVLLKQILPAQLSIAVIITVPRDNFYHLKSMLLALLVTITIIIMCYLYAGSDLMMKLKRLYEDYEALSTK